ncbi:uncharacterized protein LOC113293681 isoform X1 [Papaver somniferum]|uniref:uncharacterized protein LOC113293681 isoform X1 n=1 Tax=Papaver somniferum TaxID=3469 RepID=UPI000E70308B|nr:uncharacterized protein LOC113293681 isoform X1 [Papaver somniferum]XP_026398022.1 uncharacterized protein LOC113293681 isoform X1 [Papaver somniferum]
MLVSAVSGIGGWFAIYISKDLLLSVILAVVTTFVDGTVVKCILVKHISAGRNGAAPAVMSLKRLFCKLWGSNKNTNILPTTIQYHKEFVQERKLLEYLLLL